MSVCVSVCGYVCLSARISPEPHSRSLLNFFMHVAYVRGSVLLRHVYDRRRVVYRREGVFFLIENALSAGKGSGSAQRGRSICYLRLPCFSCRTEANGLLVITSSRAAASLKTARRHMLRTRDTGLVYPHKVHSHAIRVYGWRRGVAVTSFGESSKLLYAEPG